MGRRAADLDDAAEDLMRDDNVASIVATVVKRAISANEESGNFSGRREAAEEVLRLAVSCS